MALNFCVVGEDMLYKQCLWGIYCLFQPFLNCIPKSTLDAIEYGQTILHFNIAVHKFTLINVVQLHYKVAIVELNH